MDTSKVLRKSWQTIWQYRTLWILAMVLALTAANTIYLGPWQDDQTQPNNSRIRITHTVTLGLPGDGLSIDLTAPAGRRVVFTDADGRPIPFLALTDPSGQLGLSDIKAVAIEILILVGLIALLATIARYVAETAVIRMVSETEETGKKLTLREGLTLGWSARAARLFLIDLIIGLVGAGIIALVLSLSIGPIILVESHGFAAILLTAMGVFGMLGITGVLLVAGGLLVSLVMQTVRRACVIDDMGVTASISAGFTMLKCHLKEMGITWLIWIAIRILWAPVCIVVTLVLLPILLIFLLAGILVSLVPAALATGIAGPFVHGVTPWIIGMVAGLPVFILVAITPLLLIGGWVEIFKSSLWTFTYRALNVKEGIAQVVQPKQPLIPAQGLAR